MILFTIHCYHGDGGGDGDGGGVERLSTMYGKVFSIAVSPGKLLYCWYWYHHVYKGPTKIACRQSGTLHSSSITISSSITMVTVYGKQYHTIMLWC